MKIHFRDEAFGLALVLVCSSVSFFIWQGKGVTGHYYATLAIPIWFLAIAAYMKLRDYRIPPGYRLEKVALMLLVAISIPTFEVGKSAFVAVVSIHNTSHWVYGLYNAVATPPELEILKSKLKVGDCVQVAYGWAAGSDYMYLERDACSSVFLPNLAQKSPSLIAQLRSDLESKVPAAIIYERSFADMDVEEFETRIFNYSKVLASCYTQLQPGIFLLNQKVPDPSICVREND